MHQFQTKTQTKTIANVLSITQHMRFQVCCLVNLTNIAVITLNVTTVGDHRVEDTD